MLATRHSLPQIPFIPGIHSESEAQTIIPAQSSCTRTNILERPVTIPLPPADPHPNHVIVERHIVEKPEAPTTDIDEIKNDALRAYRRKQAELEEQQEQQSKHPLLIIKEQVEATNARGYLPYISLEAAYAGYMMWQRLEEEEELEEWWERREHEAAMRLRQQEKYRPAIREVEIQQASEERPTSQRSYSSLRCWHEDEDDLDDGWW